MKAAIGRDVAEFTQPFPRLRPLRRRNKTAERPAEPAKPDPRPET